MTKTNKPQPEIGDFSKIHKINISDIRVWLDRVEDKEINPKHICPFFNIAEVRNPCRDLCRVIFENLPSGHCPCHVFGPAAVKRTFKIVCDVHKVYHISKIPPFEKKKDK